MVSFVKAVAGLAMTVVVCALSATVAYGRLPYSSVAWSEFPADFWLTGLESPQSVYPDWQADMLQFDSYSEVLRNTGGVSAVIECRNSREGYVSVLFYSTDGQAYFIDKQLKLGNNHALVITFDLQSGDKGVSRVIFWSEPVDENQLALMARQPNWTGELIPGLKSEFWLARREKQTVIIPWEDPFGTNLIAPTSFSVMDWPAILANLEPDGLVHSKDCGISFNGLTSTTFSDFQLVGRWHLDWSTEFLIYFELPDELDFTRAQLNLHIVDEDGMYRTDGQSLEIVVNGQWITSTSIGYPFSSTVQPIAVSLSQYLEEGLNEISVRMNAFSETEWYLRGIELWVD